MMKRWFRLLAIVACVALLAVLAGCKGQTPPSMREETTAPASEQTVQETKAEPAEATTSPAAAVAEPEKAPGAESKPAEGAAAESKPAEGAAKAEGEKPAEKAETQYASSLASAGVAVGTELQRTADGKLGGKVWAMTTDGKAGKGQPKVELIAANQKGERTVLAEVKGDAGAGSVQGNTIVEIPGGTTTLLVATTLTTTGMPGPTLSLPLNDVPQVKALTIVPQ